MAAAAEPMALTGFEMAFCALALESPSDRLSATPRDGFSAAAREDAGCAGRAGRAVPLLLPTEWQSC